MGAFAHKAELLAEASGGHSPLVRETWQIPLFCILLWGANVVYVSEAGGSLHDTVYHTIDVSVLVGLICAAAALALMGKTRQTLAALRREGPLPRGVSFRGDWRYLILLTPLTLSTAMIGWPWTMEGLPPRTYWAYGGEGRWVLIAGASGLIMAWQAWNRVSEYRRIHLPEMAA